MGYYTKRRGYKPPDRKAPRFKKSKINLIDVALYKKFRKQHPGIEIDYKLFKQIILQFNKTIREGVTYTREGVELPEQLGYLFIGTCPKKQSDNPDKKLSAEYDQKIQHKNWESNQYLCKIFYSNYGNKYKFMGREYWYFKPCRQFKLEVSAAYLQNWNLYMKISPFQKISGICKEMGYKSIKVKKDDYRNRRTDFSDTQPD